MSIMIERVARELCLSTILPLPTNEDQWWNDLPSDTRSLYYHMARAAIATMRSYTPEQLNAVGRLPGRWGDIRPEAIWNAMLTAALDSPAGETR